MSCSGGSEGKKPGSLILLRCGESEWVREGVLKIEHVGRLVSYMIMLIWVRLGLELGLLCICVNFPTFDSEELLHMMYISLSPFKTIFSRLILSLSDTNQI